MFVLNLVARYEQTEIDSPEIHMTHGHDDHDMMNTVNHDDDDEHDEHGEEHHEEEHEVCVLQRYI